MRKSTFFLAIIALMTTKLSGQELMPEIWLKGDKIISKTINPDAIEERNTTMVSKTSDKHQLFNFNPTITFKEPQDSIKIPYPIDESNRFTIFTVYCSDEKSDELGIWGVKNSLRNMQLTTNRTIGPSTASSYDHGYQAVPVIHTVTQFWPSSNNENQDQEFLIGSAGQELEGINSFQGKIPELLVFRRNLSNLQRNIIESYLAIKYGITLQKTDYRNSKEKAIWDFQQNKDYLFRITGIGRDNATGLNQKQSTSSLEPNLLTIGLNKILASNNDNTGELQNMDFLLWGDNGLSLTFDLALRGSVKNAIFSSRKWKIQASGHIMDLTTEVLLNTKGLTIPIGFELALVIDRSGNGNFEHAANLEYYPATFSKELEIASFWGVNWDKDASGFDAFTFAFQPIEQKNIKSFILSPNPSKGDFKAEIKLYKEEDITLRIFDLNGRLLNVLKGNGQKHYSILSALEHSGEYIVELKFANTTTTRSLIIVE